MNTTIPHLDITPIFCNGDDFCQQFEHYWQQLPQLLRMTGTRHSRS